MASVEFIPFTCNAGGVPQETSCKHCHKLMGRGPVVLQVRQTATPFNEPHVLCRETLCFCSNPITLPIFFDSEDDAHRAGERLLAVADNLNAFGEITKVIYKMPGIVLPARLFNLDIAARPFVNVRRPAPKTQPVA